MCAAPKLPTYKEQRDLQRAAEAPNASMESRQFANLPDKLLNTMKREKKPFTYTPLSVGCVEISNGGPKIFEETNQMHLKCHFTAVTMASST